RPSASPEPAGGTNPLAKPRRAAVITRSVDQRRPDLTEHVVGEQRDGQTADQEHQHATVATAAFDAVARREPPDRSGDERPPGVFDVGGAQYPADYPGRDSRNSRIQLSSRGGQEGEKQ